MDATPPLEISFPDIDDTIVLLTSEQQLNALLRQGYTCQLDRETYPMMVYIVDNEITNADAESVILEMNRTVALIREFVKVWESLKEATHETRN